MQRTHLRRSCFICYFACCVGVICFRDVLYEINACVAVDRAAGVTAGMTFHFFRYLLLLLLLQNLYSAVQSWLLKFCPSVCLCLCLSHACFMIKRKYVCCRDCDTIWMGNPSAVTTPTIMLAGEILFQLKFALKVTPYSKTPTSRTFCMCTPTG